MERFILLDGMAIAYRAYYAFINRPLTNSAGVNVSAVYGFVSVLDKVLTDYAPDHIAVAFDTPTPTFRHTAFAEYKANRQAMPEDMVEQLPFIKDVVRGYNIPCIELPGWEADDVIGTLARRAEAEKYEVLIITPDKDFMQLVSDHITLLRPGKSADAFERVDRTGVAEKFGVAPEQVVDVLGLTGDQSDNIPGVKGIGEKTAIPLIQQFGSLPTLYERIEDVAKPGIRAKLLEYREDAFLSRDLATIRIDAPVDVDPENLRRSTKNHAQLRELFSRLELRRFLQTLDAECEDSNAPAVATIATTPHEYHIVETEEELHAMVDQIRTQGICAFDTETTSTNPHLASLVGMSFAIRAHEAWYVPCNHRLSTESILSLLSPLWSGEVRFVGQNLKFDLLVLRSHGIVCDAVDFDTMIAAYLLNPEGEHGMDALSLAQLGYAPVSIDTLIGKGKQQRSMAEVPLEDIAAYAAEDADVTWRLFDVLRPRVEGSGQEALLREIEFPLISVLADMEATGIRIDGDALREAGEEMGREIQALATRIHHQAGGEFNIGSPRQLGAVLFDTLGLPSGKKTQTGYSTDISVLEGLRGMHPIVDDILEYRQLTKLKSTYIDTLPTLINPRTGRVHTSFNQAVAATGRLSSTDPNLQNIPIRTERGREIRRAFVPGSADHVLLSADYSQIELRLAAELTGDEGLLQAFAEGEDIHTSTAIRLFGVTREQVTPEMRRRAKTVNFGILYGISAFGLAQRLGISNTEGKDLIDLYFSKYSRINQWISSTLISARERGFVETMKGRRRYLPDINSKNRNIRLFAERMAINAPIQGSAADLIKIAMIRIHQALRRDGFRAHMILQVHDELVFDVPRDEVESLRPLIVHHMRTAMNLAVPIEVEVGVGESWFEAHA